MVPLKLLALVIPLSLDTFAVSASLGLAGLSARERWRLSLIMSGFEAVMPLLGFAAGAVAGQALSSFADYVAAGLLVLVGLLMLRGDDAVGDDRVASRMRGLAMVGVGVSVSLDELAIGLVIGLLRLPVVAVALLIGAQALVASQLGAALGSRLSGGIGERTEQAAGVLLILLGAGLAVLKFSGHAV